MAPIGGGPPVGSANPFTGPSGSLNFLGRSRIDGRHFWGGYSGAVALTTDTDVTMMEYESPPNYAMIHELVWGAHDIEMNSTNAFILKVTLDDVVVLWRRSEYSSDGQHPAATLFIPIPIYIGAQTRVKIITNMESDVNAGPAYVIVNAKEL